MYPFVYTEVCAAFTQAGGDTTLSFEVLVFDDDGPGGGPGTLLGTVPALVGGVPAWLNHTFASVDIQGSGVAVDDGSVFIGVGWNEATEAGFYVAADESLETPAQDGYYSDNGAAWTSLSSSFPGYRSLMVRADGFSPADGEWEQVVGSIFGGGNGFGDPWNTSVVAMGAFNGELYVGTKNQFGSEINYTTDGGNWFLGNTPGFGDPANDGISNLIVFDGRLYAATFNSASGTQLWRTDAPWAWTFVEGGGFGDTANISTPSSTVFGDHLYLGTSHAGGCEIWRSSGGLSWSQVHSNGFGNSQNEVAESMAAFRGELWVGTRNTSGAELWKSPDGVVWFAMMSGGFDSSSNSAIKGLTVYDKMLYAGVSNTVTGAQIWRSTNGTTWTQVVGDGLGNPAITAFDTFAIGDLGLMASVSGSSSPGSIWLSTDGLTWTPMSSPGFSNPENEGIPSLFYWADRVWAGTSNPTSGCEVWRGGRHPVFEEGFESGDTNGWSVVAP